MTWTKYLLINYFYMIIKVMSFLTWIGSKKRLLGHINKVFDQYIADDAIYVEPFLGSGVVLVDVLEKH